jgi:RNA polymerase sigma-70 factor (ECF subfamily)
MTRTGQGQRAPAGHLRVVGAPDDATREDVALVAAYLRHDPGASAALWERYYPLVRQVLARAIGPRHDVDDLVQEVFMRLFRKLGSLREPAALRAFVLTITARVVKSELRLRWLRRWLRLEGGDEMPEPAGAGADLDAREALARFYGILDRMGPAPRAAFVLRHVEGLELVDVAAALDVSLATVKRWLGRVAPRVLAQAARDPVLAAYLPAPDVDGGERR